MAEKQTQGLKPIAPSLRQLVASSSECSNGTPPLTAAKASQVLFGCYRAGDANDPETYTAAVAAVLATYPSEVVKRVTDPRTGLAGRSKWLPTVSEVREACEEIVRAEAIVAERQRRIAAQIAARKADDERRASHPRPTLDELKAKYGPNWGLQSDVQKSEQERRQRAFERSQEFYERECVSGGLPPNSLYSPALLNTPLMERARAHLADKEGSK